MAQLIALAKADQARRTCGTCDQVHGYYIPRSLGECLDCADRTNHANARGDGAGDAPPAPGGPVVQDSDNYDEFVSAPADRWVSDEDGDV